MAGQHQMNKGEWLWGHRLVDDPREPFLIFSFSHGNYGLYLPMISFIAQLNLWVALSFVIGLAAALVLYPNVVRQARTSRAYLVGYGILIPTYLVIIPAMVDAVGMENMVLRFYYSTVLIFISFFRTLEAMYGFTPAYAQASLLAYVMYFVLPVNFLHDPKANSPVKLKFSEQLEMLWSAAALTIILGLYMSLFLVWNDFPSIGKYEEGSRDQAELTIYSWQSIFRPHIWGRSALYAMVVQLLLATLGQWGRVAAAFLLGLKTMPFMQNPLLGATSPSDFWARRWNLFIHNLLKQSVYKPVRWLGGSQAIAVIGTFMASGLYHEAVNHVTLIGYRLRYGTTLAFFLWQAILVAIEQTVGRYEPLAGAVVQLPSLVRTFLCVLVGLPLAHWFLEPYVRSDFLYPQIAVLLPIIRPIPVHD